MKSSRGPRKSKIRDYHKKRALRDSGAIDAELTLPGEPLPYAIKFDVGKRMMDLSYFRNKKWMSMIKCFFKSYMNTDTPCVLFVRFYVSPPIHADVNRKLLYGDKNPATRSYEVCDYLLSFMEMIHRKLINSYRQIVKLDVEKYYSTRPRTVFKFMSWENYIGFQKDKRKSTDNAETIDSVKNFGLEPLQSVRKGTKGDKEGGIEAARQRYLETAFEGTDWGGPTFSNAVAEEHGEVAEGEVDEHSAQVTP